MRKARGPWVRSPVALPEFFFLRPSVSTFFLRLVCWNGLIDKHFFFRYILYQYMWQSSLLYFFGISICGKHHVFIFHVYLYQYMCQNNTCFCFLFFSKFFISVYVWNITSLFFSGIIFISTCGKHHYCIFFVSVYVGNITSLFFRYIFISTCGKTSLVFFLFSFSNFLYQYLYPHPNNQKQRHNKVLAYLEACRAQLAEVWLCLEAMG